MTSSEPRTENRSALRLVVCPNHGPQLCGCYQCNDWEIVPVVPCDRAAIERGAEAIAKIDGIKTSISYVMAEAVLRAAGETER